MKAFFMHCIYGHNYEFHADNGFFSQGTCEMHAISGILLSARLEEKEMTGHEENVQFSGV